MKEFYNYIFYLKNSIFRIDNLYKVINNEKVNNIISIFQIEHKNSIFSYFIKYIFEFIDNFYFEFYKNHSFLFKYIFLLIFLLSIFTFFNIKYFNNILIFLILYNFIFINYEFINIFFLNNIYLNKVFLYDLLNKKEIKIFITLDLAFLIIFFYNNFFSYSLIFWMLLIRPFTIISNLDIFILEDFLYGSDNKNKAIKILFLLLFFISYFYFKKINFFNIFNCFLGSLFFFVGITELLDLNCNFNHLIYDSIFYSDSFLYKFKVISQRDSFLIFFWIFCTFLTLLLSYKTKKIKKNKRIILINKPNKKFKSKIIELE